MKKILWALVVTAIITLGVYKVYIFLTYGEISAEGATTTKSISTIDINNTDYNNLNMDLKVENLNSKYPINVEIINPEKEVCKKIIVHGNKKEHVKDLRFKAVKGLWQVKISRDDMANLEYSYTVEYSLDNKFFDIEKAEFL